MAFEAVEERTHPRRGEESQREIEAQYSVRLFAAERP